jgi:hypothetical protein
MFNRTSLQQHGRPVGYAEEPDVVLAFESRKLLA